MMTSRLFENNRPLTAPLYDWLRKPELRTSEFGFEFEFEFEFELESEFEFEFQFEFEFDSNSNSAPTRI